MTAIIGILLYLLVLLIVYKLIKWTGGLSNDPRDNLWSSKYDGEYHYKNEELLK